MNKNNFLKTTIIGTLLLFSFLFIGCASQTVSPVANNTLIVQNTNIINNTPVVNVTNVTKVYNVRSNVTNIIFLPQSTIIVTPANDVIVFDAGDENHLIQLNQVLVDNNLTRIKYLILPTPKRDGAAYLAIRYKPLIYYTGIPSSFEDFKKYTNYSIVSSRTVLDTDVFVEIIPPYENRGLYVNNDDNSLVLKVVYGSYGTLLLGDCGVGCQQSLSEGVSVLGVGKSNTFDLEFLTRTAPSNAVVPNKIVVSQLDYLGIKTFSEEKNYLFNTGSILEINP